LITLTDNANNVSGSTESVVVTGFGNSDVSVSVVGLNFATILAGTTETMDVTVSNIGTIPNLTVGTSYSGAGFTTLTTGNTCTSGVAPGKSCVLPIEFDPTLANPYAISLTISTNGGLNPVIPLTGTATGVVASMSTPAPSSALTSSTVTFTWGGGVGVADYELWVGSTGVGSSNLFYPGLTTSTSETVSGLPTNGETLYVRLFSKLSGAWQFKDYTYTAVSGNPATLTTPAPGSTLTSSTVTFGWSGGVNVSEYELWVGTTGVGSSNINYPGLTTSTSESVSGLPTTGGTVYVRLLSKVNGVWQSADYTYTAQ
jgi:hypothetical protein